MPKAHEGAVESHVPHGGQAEVTVQRGQTQLWNDDGEEAWVPEDRVPYWEARGFHRRKLDLVAISASVTEHFDAAKRAFADMAEFVQGCEDRVDFNHAAFVTATEAMKLLNDELAMWQRAIALRPAEDHESVAVEHEDGRQERVLAQHAEHFERDGWQRVKEPKE
jgi:hypothetical protein